MSPLNQARFLSLNPIAFLAAWYLLTLTACSSAVSPNAEKAKTATPTSLIEKSIEAQPIENTASAAPAEPTKPAEVTEPQATFSSQDEINEDTALVTTPVSVEAPSAQAVKSAEAPKTIEAPKVIEAPKPIETAEAPEAPKAEQKPTPDTIDHVLNAPKKRSILEKVKRPLPLPNLGAREPENNKFKVYRLPEFNPKWGLSRSIYERGVRQYDGMARDLKNPRFVTMVDFSKHKNEKRFYVFDLQRQKVIKLLTTHGKNSDRGGMAAFFSNTDSSLKSSLGFYLTGDPYIGEHGFSMRLLGQDPSNSKALDRGIVIHTAAYVNEDTNTAGLSWGCLVLDRRYYRSVINQIKGGSLLYVSR